MNKNDSERIASFLLENGYKKAKIVEDSELIITNMCSVRQSAVDRVYGLIPKFEKLKKEKKVKTILTGCFLERDRKKFEKKFDYVLSIKTLPNWNKILSEKTAEKMQIPEENIDYLKIKPNYNSKFQAFVPVSTGCNMRCTYCAVPLTRGKEICRDHREILEEVHGLVKKGYKEIWLLGQIVNSYRSPTNKKITLVEIIKEINSMKGDFWLKMTSPHPSFFNDKLISAMAKSEKFASYLNLPAQSGDNNILKAMRRPYDRKYYCSLVDKIRTAFKQEREKEEKEIAISTDIIVGFPGETKRAFENTEKLMREIKFDMAYIAQFSPRPGTEAEKIEDNVPKKEKERREKELTKILSKTALEHNKKFIGRTIRVLVTSKKENRLLGISRHQKNVIIENNEDNLIGNFVFVKIKKVSPWHLVGEITTNGKKK